MADNTEVNRSHWEFVISERAASYETKFAEMIKHISEQIRERREWIGVDWVREGEGTREVRLLDYACGTGLVSKALAPYVTQSIGIDLTEGMVKAYNTSAQTLSIPPSKMHAIQGNLLSPTDPSPAHLTGAEFFNFDIAVVSGGFHHFDDPALAASRLAERLKKGGVMLVIDFMPKAKEDMEAMIAEGGDSDDVKVLKTITHFGFGEETMRGIFEGAGVGGEFGFVVIGEGFVFGDGHGHGHGHGEERVVEKKKGECKCGKEHPPEKVVVEEVVGHGHDHGGSEASAQGIMGIPFMAKGVKL